MALLSHLQMDLPIHLKQACKCRSTTSHKRACKLQRALHSDLAHGCAVCSHGIAYRVHPYELLRCYQHKRRCRVRQDNLVTHCAAAPSWRGSVYAAMLLTFLPCCLAQVLAWRLLLSVVAIAVCRNLAVALAVLAAAFCLLLLLACLLLGFDLRVQEEEACKRRSLQCLYCSNACQHACNTPTAHLSNDLFIAIARILLKRCKQHVV